jgi:hypothetical protein
MQVARNVHLDFKREIRIGVVEPFDESREPSMDDRLGDAQRNVSMTLEHLAS